MESMQEILNAFNARLAADGFSERFTLETVPLENGATLEMLVIPHKKAEFSIALQQDDGMENAWIIEYFGTHSHLYFIETLEELFNVTYEDIQAILNDEIAVAYKDQAEVGLNRAMCSAPKEISLVFSDEEKERAKKFRVARWSGEIDDINLACYILREIDKR